MEIPENFRESIESFFYDKTFELYSINTSLDSEGGDGECELIKLKDSKGNIQINNNEYNLKEYGFEIDADYKVTTNTSIELGNFMKYKNEYYKIIKLLKFDSHNVFWGVLDAD